MVDDDYINYSMQEYFAKIDHEIHRDRRRYIVDGIIDLRIIIAL